MDTRLAVPRVSAIHVKGVDCNTDAKGTRKRIPTYYTCPY